MRMSLELSDSLTQLSRDLDQFTHGGVTLDGETAHRLARHVANLRDQARELENEVSRSRWNRAAHLERLADEEIVASEALKPGTNLVLFPPAFRPFSDGRHPGGAA